MLKNCQLSENYNEKNHPLVLFFEKIKKSEIICSDEIMKEIINTLYSIQPRPLLNVKWEKYTSNKKMIQYITTKINMYKIKYLKYKKKYILLKNNINGIN